ncbi:MAG: prolyl oligopeptidase family serine peptidase [Chryseosolibacter sp.]
MELHYEVMKVRILILLFAFSLVRCEDQDLNTGDIETEPPILNANFFLVNEVVGGYYSGLPAHYHETSRQYPTIIFIHGAGQHGDGDGQLHHVLNEAIPELLQQKRFPASFTVHGSNYSFIILAPQFSIPPTDTQVLSFINYAKDTYRIDTARIFLVGFSEGGTTASDVAAAHPGLFAALVAIAGVSKSGDVESKCKSIADNHLPVWLFHNDMDQLMDVNLTRNFASLINSFHPPIPPKYTEFLPYGLWNHDAWTKATDPAFKENGMNIYEWMLQYRR